MALPDITAGQPLYDRLVDETNCASENDTLDCLRSAPLQTLLNFVESTPNLFGFHGLNLAWQPSVDAKVIMLNPLDSYAQGLYTKVTKFFLSEVYLLWTNLGPCCLW